MRLAASLALILAACSSGRTVSPSTPCEDLDGDGHPAATCGGDDCDDRWDRVRPGAPEVCGNGADDDCDGKFDENCICNPGTQERCYPPGLQDPTLGVGDCHAGLRICIDGGTAWGPCDGFVEPVAEVACDGVDQDCDGDIDVIAPEICNSLDDDCDGVIDEDGDDGCSPCDVGCFTVDFHEPGSCWQENERVCDRIIPDDNNPDAFTLPYDCGRGGCEGATNVLYVAVPGRDQVAKLDTLTGQIMWQVDSFGDAPRTLAVPLDNSVWVANQGLDKPSSSAFSNAVHLDRDGNLICVAEVPGLAAGLAIDAYGDVWAGTFSSQELFKVSGTGVGPPGVDGLPRCDLYDLDLDGPGVSLPLGVSVSGLMTLDDVLWTSSVPAMRIDTTTLVGEGVNHADADGIASDLDGNVWFGGGRLHRLRASGPYVDPRVYETTLDQAATDVAVDEDGRIWALGSGALLEIEPEGLAVVEHPLPGPADGIVSDEKFVWALGTDGFAHRYEPSEDRWSTYPVDPGHSIASRATSAWPAVRRTRRFGSWTQRHDAGFDVRWKRLDWQYLRPGSTLIEATVTLTTSKGASIVCGPYLDPPANLASCPGAEPARVASIRFDLRAYRSEERPTVGLIRLVGVSR